MDTVIRSLYYREIKAYYRLLLKEYRFCFASLTSQNQLPCHKESRGACGAVVVDVDDGDPGQAQAVVNGPLPTCGVP